MRWGLSARPGRQPESAVGVVMRGLTLLVVVWQALWVVSDSRLWPAAAESAWGQAAVWLAVAGWLALFASYAAGRPRLMRLAAWINVACLLVCAGVRTLDASLAGHGLSGDGGFFVIAAGAAGFLLAMRPATVITALAVLGEAAFVVAGSAPGGFTHAESLGLLFPLFALTSGAASIGARSVLVAAAMSADDATVQSQAAEEARVRADFISGEMRDKERLLHEAVLNTLVAISRGGISLTAATRVRISARCEESAQVLREFLQVIRSRGMSPAGLTTVEELDSAVADARAARLKVMVDVGALDGLPAPVRSVLVVAIREAVLNATRHSAAGTLTVRSHRARSGRVRVEVADDGVGFDPSAAARGFGLTSAITEGMALVGGSAVVESSPGAGTRVILEWDPEPADPEGFDLAGFVLPLLGAFAVYCGVAVAMSWGYLPHPWFAVGGMALLLLTDAFLARSTRYDSLGWNRFLLALGSGVLIFWMQQQSSLGVPWQNNADWGSAATISIYIVLAGIGPRGSFLLVLVTWLFLQGDPLRELLSAGTAILVACALFGRSMRRMARQLDQARHRVREAEAAERAAEQAASMLQVRYGGLEAGPAIDLLDAIARGELAADDPQAMARAEHEERYLRIVLRVDPGRSQLHALIAEWARTCHARAVDLSISLPEGDTGFRQVPDEVRQWSAVMNATIPSSQARLTLRDEDGTFVLRLVAQVDKGERDAMIAMGGIDTDPGDPDSAVVMWEARAMSDSAPILVP